MQTISEKITLLNQTTLDSLNQADTLTVVKNFTEAGIKILGADFGFAWWKMGETDENYQLAYKSDTTPYNPTLPREQGINDQVQKNKISFFVESVKKEDDPDRDVSPYMKSYVIIPIFYKNQIYGNLIICFIKSHHFSQEERNLCQALGNSAAQAITIHRLVKSEHEARLEADYQKERMQSLIENSYEIIAMLSPAGKIKYISPSVERMTGYSPEFLTGRDFYEFLYDKDVNVVNTNIQNLLTNKSAPAKLEFRTIKRDGSLRWMEATAVNMLDNPGIASIVVNLRDISDRKASQEEILHQASHDALTNLLNRKEFTARLDHALQIAKRHKRKLGVMFLDLDRFKNINDSLGHTVGDTLLKVVASRLASSVRSEDVVSRFGGDEFVILLNELHEPKEAAAVAEKILKAINIPVKIDDHTFHPSVSIGIAMYPNDGEDRQTLKKHADIALYRAKANGRNTYSLYDPGLDTYATEKFSLEIELRQALELNQIVLFYQPILSLKTGRVVAVEALARWQHPHKGLILPKDFIPFAEETGLIKPLSDYILKSICEQHKNWQADGFPTFRIAMNLSARSFTQNSFIPRLSKTLAECSMEAENLELEITETTAMSNLELTENNLKELKKMGVRITIDDFGTGYSSLSYLKRFPINSLKIDQSFVRGCIASDQDAGIVRTIISMAKSLNLKVVAEGVETEQQLHFLQALGCNAVQGFYIGRPMAVEDLKIWLQEKGFKKKQSALEEKQQLLEMVQIFLNTDQLLIY